MASANGKSIFSGLETGSTCSGCFDVSGLAGAEGTRPAAVIDDRKNPESVMKWQMLTELLACAQTFAQVRHKNLILKANLE